MVSLVADPPPVIASVPASKPADVVVVSRDTGSDVLASRDTPLPLIRGRRTEDALLRQTLFLTRALTVVRPAAGTGEEVLRWTYEPYLQRQLCFTSMTGVFACAAAEVEELTGTAAGETPLPAAPEQVTPSQAAEGPPTQAQAVRAAVAEGLHARADALFDDDRRLKLDPMLKAAGVAIRRTSVPARPARR